MSAGEMQRRYRGGRTRSGWVRRGAGLHWSAMTTTGAGGLPATGLAFELMEEENHGGKDVVGGGPAAAVLEPRQTSARGALRRRRGGGREEGGGAVDGGGPPGSPRGDASGTGRGVVLPTFLSYSNVFVWFNNSQIWLVKQKWPDKKANLSIQPPSKCKKSS